MILLDINKPADCAFCLCSFKLPSSNDILCRKDMKKHKPMDSTCPIKAEFSKEQVDCILNKEKKF